MMRNSNGGEAIVRGAEPMLLIPESVPASRMICYLSRTTRVFTVKSL